MKKKIYLAICLFTLTCFSISAQKQDPVIDQDNSTKDQIILDDLIVDGSTCVGFDCVNGESFGFDTHRLKENNVRIHFNDTSNSSSFPNNDWRIVINDSNNGGANYFAIEDASAGRQVFRVEAAAPANSLYVDDGGRIGFGTSTPVVELHVVDGDSPTMRLEQDGSSGFTPQTWDVAGNETNFFIRDATNGSKLPFKIRPGAATNSIYIDTNGNVGLGDTSPDEKLHVLGNAKVQATSNTDSTFVVSNVENKNLFLVQGNGNVGIGNTNPDARLVVEDNSVNASITVNITGTSNSRSGLRLRRQNTTTGGVFSNGSSDLVFLAGGNVERGSFKANGDFIVDGNIIASSDKRLKKNVKSYDKGLDAVLKLNPITYEYNLTGAVYYEESKVGLFAQELHSVAPEMTTDLAKVSYDSEGNAKSEGNYLGIHENEIKYLLINSIKEQQKSLEEKDLRISALENEVESLSSLKSEVEDLKSILNEITSKLASGNSLTVNLEKNQAFLGQNFPNPHKGETSIDYFIPENSKSASLKVYDISGKLIKSISINTKGAGKLNLMANELNNGNYVYSLFINEQVFETRKMILSK